MDIKWIEWVLSNKKQILYSFVLAVAIFILGVRGFRYFGKTEKNPYLEAGKAYKAWKDSSENSSNLADLHSSIKQLPHLKDKYYPLIAQGYLNQGNVEEALRYAEQKQDLSFYTSYSDVTFLIAQSRYREALDLSKALKKRMEDDKVLQHDQERLTTQGALLYGYNLMRIAFLEQLLETSEEYLAWNELDLFLDNWDSLSKTLQISFHEKNLSLKDYISHRKTLFLTRD